MRFKLQWAMARRAYRIAPHGTRRARLKDLQKLVTNELIAERSRFGQGTKNRVRGKIAA